jgi:hypothetical protein
MSAEALGGMGSLTWNSANDLGRLYVFSLRGACVFPLELCYRCLEAQLLLVEGGCLEQVLAWGCLKVCTDC